MTTVVLSPVYNGVACQDNNGNLLAGGYLYAYQQGSFTVLQPTYTDHTGSVQNANPIQLSSTGRLPNALWLDASLNYNLVLTLADGTTIVQYTDNISSSSVTGATVTSITAGTGITISSSTGNVTISTGSAGWQTGTMPLYISGTSFSVLGNQTATYKPDTRIQAIVTAGTVYGSILTSSYSGITGITTITLQMDDADALDSGLSVVEYSIVSALSTPASSQMIVTPINNAGTYYPILASGTGTNPQSYIIDPDGALVYNPATDILTGNFSGNFSGNTSTINGTITIPSVIDVSSNITISTTNIDQTFLINSGNLVIHVPTATVAGTRATFICNGFAANVVGSGTSFVFYGWNTTPFINIPDGGQLSLTWDGTTWGVTNQGAGIGTYQTWTSPTRAFGSVYQNTTGQAKMISAWGGTGGGGGETLVTAGPANPPTLVIAWGGGYNGVTGVQAIIPAGWYYKITTWGGSTGLVGWTEFG